MKIALVYPPCQELNLKGYPLGLAYLSASLKRKHVVDIYDYNGCHFKKSLSEFFSSVKKTKPDAVAISFNSFNRLGAYRIINKIKSINNDIFVILGGVHPSTMYVQVFCYFFDRIDFIIQSEGEQSLYKLCNALEAKEDYSDISGLVYKDSRGNLQANPVTEIEKDIDNLPFPDYSYCSDSIKKQGIGYLITSRGCPVNCSFCSTSSFWGQNIRMNSPERVGEEAGYLKGFGARKIFFHDDTFNLGIERTIKIANIIKKLNLEYAIQCRVTPVTEEMIAILVNSGCRHITWGVESLSEKIINRIDKKITREQVRRAFDICARFTDKLTTSAFFCVGTPGETEDTIQESIEYLNQNIRSTHGPGASMLYILPGTRIYSDLLKAGVFDERIWVRGGSVYYYTAEHNIKTLNRWRKMINRSGIRIPYSAPYFWDTVPSEQKDRKILGSRQLAKIVKKINRSVNMLRKRY